MTPKEFVTIQQHEQSLIDQAQERIDAARAAAEECPIPKRLRPATYDDILPGAIIWHKRSKKDGGPFWVIVDRYSGGSQYTSDDGCVYSTENTFVEK